uniref:UDP-N-acetylglucosamine--peptide N-acetylglucosaminyltransferase SPINDLY n=1 Tax=Rhodosorus marinus TaxID=101924 RepID=A0A7S3ED52_9RHOD|mmetsp:Transcript_23358/g.92884  ORF Transcript_23358/g.92884 Transcript_23358/m.92884 type:complete len:498 (+) Transcript_23358:576-2069(+)|eukprot:CAMPEP_0113957902 /NCGR_PEP_ID=MMETSP0011_2-20120614/3038_1 /TAXON_ID=101924 /ORGANISM="Rhodosorus marinus" /LENGTH=497 /DNA_ID=CAMNT_0000968537 /DNA_START=425 /DNA_END=1918 /DNA_ORIENTATION=- /assembly_acc=CAM_ASM_000156
MKGRKDFGKLRGGRDLAYEARIRSMNQLHPEIEAKLRAAREAVWMRFASLRATMDENEGAIAEYKTVLMQNPNNGTAALEIGSILAKAKDYEEAVKYVKKALEIDPENGRAWGILGHCFVNKEDLPLAYEAYCKALTFTEVADDPDLWYGIGLLHDHVGSLDLALEAFLEVLNVDPNFRQKEEVMFYIGITYKEKEEYANALDCLNRVITMLGTADESQPPPLSRADTLFLIGHVYELQGDTEQAMEAYQASLQVNPKTTKVLQQYAWLLHRAHKSDEALQILQKAVENSQSEAHGSYLTARIYIDRKEYQLAYTALQQAIFVDNHNPFYWCTIGVLYSAQMQYKDAMDAYTRAIRMNPYVYEVWYNLAALYHACNQPEDSVEAFERALEISPNNKDIQEALEIVRGRKGQGETEGPKPKMPPANPFATVLRAPQQKQQQQHLAQFASMGMDLRALAKKAKAKTNKKTGANGSTIAGGAADYGRWGGYGPVALETNR